MRANLARGQGAFGWNAEYRAWVVEYRPGMVRCV